MTGSSPTKLARAISPATSSSVGATLAPVRVSRVTEPTWQHGRPHATWRRHTLAPTSADSLRPHYDSEYEAVSAARTGAQDRVLPVQNPPTDPSLFFFKEQGNPRDLPSFPPRPSSD